MIVFPTRSPPPQIQRVLRIGKKKFNPHTVRASPSFINYNLILQLVPPTYFLLQIYYLYNLVLLLPSHTRNNCNKTTCFYFIQKYSMGKICVC